MVWYSRIMGTWNIKFGYVTLYIKLRNKFSPIKNKEI